MLSRKVCHLPERLQICILRFLRILPDSELTERGSLAASKPTASKPVRMPWKFFTLRFFSPRGSPNSVVKFDIAGRVYSDAVHYLMSRSDTNLKIEVGYRRCYLERRTARSTILLVRQASVSRLQQTLCSILGPSLGPHPGVILWRITKISTFAPDASCSPKDIFDEKIPAVNGCTDTATEEGDVNAAEKHIVNPELIAYLKWLIYTAPFKDPFAEP